ncbi:MAG: methionine--tRNA ligase [Patescibacteria group bacterium]|nr:methionine--tRNA ligase [Patescibacteria group bacterium]
MSKFYLTTPIYYVNDQPHLGHAYTTIAADVLARYYRMKGDQVFFLTGTDEHGAKIAESAEKNKKTPQEWCDEMSARFKLAWDVLNISYDNFIRTTDQNHEQAVKKAITRLYQKGWIKKGLYEGLYCVGCERYYTTKELIDGRCPDHQRVPERVSEECYLFKLSAFQKPLLRLIDEKTLVIEPEKRKNEVVGFLKTEKLEDVSISRKRVQWGIPLPWDGSQTLYVWIDAFLNYLTGLGWDGEERVPELWPADLQLMAKDILRVHSTIWPALLLALEVPLPKKIFAHGFFTVNGQKMSKSLGNVLDPIEQAKNFSSDGLRWLLLSSFPFGVDGDVSLEKFYEKYKADLANGIGNLVARVLALATKLQLTNYKLKKEREWVKKIERVWRGYQRAMEKLAFEEVAKEILNFIALVDREINKKEPWRLLKTNLVEFQKVIYNLLESLRQLAWLIQPLMPETADKIFDQLGILSSEKKKNLEEAKEWGGVEFDKIKKGEILFPRL